MDRLACVELPAFPLQVLLRRHPEWEGHPAAVVEADRPQAMVLWVNKLAREGGVKPGLRYAAALSLAPGLRAGPVSADEIALAVRGLTDRLHDFSPEIEPAAHEPGVFWLDAGGLEHLFPSSEAWALAVRHALAEAGYVAGVVVGFRRFGTYAVAKAIRARKTLVLESPEQELTVAHRVPLDHVGLPPAILAALTKLGVERVGDLLKLSAHGLRRRFGPEAHTLYRFASGELDVPLNPVPVVVPHTARLELDYRETSAERLIFVIKPLVDQLLTRLHREGLALAAITLELALEDVPAREETIRTAEPTLASVTVMELVQLRLNAEPLGAPVVGVVVTAEAVTATAEQLAMFVSAPKRDMAAVSRAFARLRAAFGHDDVVARAVMRDRHSPEGCFTWEPLHRLDVAHPHPEPAPTLVRRLLARPEPVMAQPRRSPDGWLLRGPEGGPVINLQGPYRLAGGWWKSDVQRDYYYAELGRGDLLWVYYDRERRRWFLQGEFV